MIHEVLPHGKQNAVPGRDLVAIVGVKDLRVLTQMLEGARQSGIPVCASTAESKGYYLPETPEELAAYLRSFDRRLKSMMETRRGLERALLEMSGQCQIESWGD